jgi:hypothetical protein
MAFLLNRPAVGDEQRAQCGPWQNGSTCIVAPSHPRVPICRLQVAFVALLGSFQVGAWPQLGELKQQPLTQMGLHRVRDVPGGQVALN